MWVAVACYVGAAAMWVIPDRRIESVIAVGPGEHGTDGEAGHPTAGSASGS
jgi:hypothetical protein